MIPVMYSHAVRTPTSHKIFNVLLPPAECILSRFPDIYCTLSKALTKGTDNFVHNSRYPTANSGSLIATPAWKTFRVLTLRDTPRIIWSQYILQGPPV